MFRTGIFFPRALTVLLLLGMMAVPARIYSAHPKLAAGPMPGYAEMREAVVWAQSTEAAEMVLEFWPEGDSADVRSSEAVQTTAENAFTAKLLATDLMPGTVYRYRLRIDGQVVDLPYATRFQTIPDFRGRSPAPDFSVAFAGANYVNDAPFDPLNRIPGGDYQIYQAILDQQPDLLIWVGNAVHLREADWGSRSGIFSRYSHNRAHPELQPLLAGTHHIATWSRHDFGPEGGDRFSGSRNHAREAFEAFWPNPAFGMIEDNAIFCKVRWSDVEFFILDDRYHRDLTARSSNRHVILGENQIEWLVQSLKRSTATFKIIVMGSAILSPAEGTGNYRQAARERERLLERLRDEKIANLFFVSGGKSHGELTRMVWRNAPDIHDLTVGPLTARAARSTDEFNHFRVPNTALFERHFAVFRFEGAEEDRKIVVTTYNVNGEALWSRTFEARDMGY